jgi:hypothetical protein
MSLTDFLKTEEAAKIREMNNQLRDLVGRDAEPERPEMQYTCECCGKVFGHCNCTGGCE